jgi:hypothetical protein
VFALPCRRFRQGEHGGRRRERQSGSRHRGQ